MDFIQSAFSGATDKLLQSTSNTFSSASSSISTAVSPLLSSSSEYLSQNGVTPTTIAKFLAVSIGIGLAVAVVGKGISELGKSSKIPAIEKIGDATFKVGELALKTVLVPPIAVGIGIKWMIFEGIPSAITGGRVRRMMSWFFGISNKFIFHPLIYVLLIPAVIHVVIILVASFYAALELEYLFHVKLLQAVMLPFAIVNKTYSLIVKGANKTIYTTINAIIWIHTKIVKPTYIWIRDNIVLPFHHRVIVPTKNGIVFVANKIYDASISVGTKVSNGLVYLWNNFYSVASNVGTKLYNGGAASGKFLLDKVLVPAVDASVNVARLVKNVIVDLLIFIGRQAVRFYDNVLVPFAKGVAELGRKIDRAAQIAAVWFYRTIIVNFGQFLKYVIVNLYQFLKKVVVGVYDGIIWFLNKTLVPLVEGFVWCWNKFFEILFYVLAKIGNAVAISAHFVWNRIFKPVILLVVFVVVTISRKIAAAAVWFWQRVLYPVVMFIYNLVVTISYVIYNAVVAIGSAIASAAQTIWTTVVQPLITLITNVVVSVANVIKTVAISVSNVVVQTVSAVTKIVTQTVTAVANIVTQVVQSVAKGVW